MSKVKDIMTLNPVTVSVDTIATKIRSILRDGDFRAVPVVNRSRLEGMITRGDIINISATKSNVDAHGIMSHISVGITEDMDINEAAKKLINAEEVQAPVTKSSEEMQLVGMISVVDIIKKFVDDDFNPKYKKLEDIVTKDIVTCNYDDQISNVWNRMDDTGFSGLPVIKKKKLIGIITRKDIINSGHVRIVKESNEMKGSAKVESIMRTPPIVATPDKEVKEAAKIMIENDIGRLPVVEHPVYIKKEPIRAREADLIGIVAREDILRAYIS
ncbi:HPP family protein [Methanobacterium sp.]|uniref:CBS domain-containing protein n=1 Tax=Methanobacterium sp. TaxID=2164 RepID=UPI003C782C56